MYYFTNFTNCTKDSKNYLITYRNCNLVLIFAVERTINKSIARGE